MERGVVECLVNLITCGHTFELENCELVFRFGSNGKYFDRGKHFKTADALYDYMRLKHYTSIEFGAVYPGKDPKQERQDAMLIKHFPLVFDIDVDDDKIDRTCACKNYKKVCDECWREFMTPALSRVYDFLDKIMKYKSILIVFSGRRGAHVWVLDPCVWEYTLGQRQRILTEFNDVKLLDTPVTLDFRHLIKLPLSLHPATGTRSVLIDKSSVPSEFVFAKNIAEINKKILQWKK